jgi:hypothetical protein
VGVTVMTSVAGPEAVRARAIGARTRLCRKTAIAS